MRSHIKTLSSILGSLTLGWQLMATTPMLSDLDDWDQPAQTQVESPKSSSSSADTQQRPKASKPFKSEEASFYLKAGLDRSEKKSAPTKYPSTEHSSFRTTESSSSSYGSDREPSQRQNHFSFGSSSSRDEGKLDATSSKAAAATDTSKEASPKGFADRQGEAVKTLFGTAKSPKSSNGMTSAATSEHASAKPDTSDAASANSKDLDLGGPEVNDPSMGTESATLSVYVVCFFSGLIFLYLWYQKQLKGRSQGPRGLPIETLGQTWLDGQTKIIVVRVGSKVLIMAKSNHFCTTLDTITDPEEINLLTLGAGATGTEDFSSLLKQMTKRGKKSTDNIPHEAEIRSELHQLKEQLSGMDKS